MKIEKKQLKLFTLMAGLLIAGAFAFFIVQANGLNISEIQKETTEIAELSKGTSTETASFASIAKCDDGGKCGEGKCGDGDKKSDADKEKCGEGKCGDGDSKKKSDKKCGEGKCGEGDSDKKSDKEKCGEGKCGK
jgi:uncharacterized low-complexity protein